MTEICRHQKSQCWS